MVDAARIVEGEAWASKPKDGRHYHKIVPLEVGVRPVTVPVPPVGVELIPCLSHERSFFSSCLHVLTTR